MVGAPLPILMFVLGLHHHATAMHVHGQAQGAVMSDMHLAIWTWAVHPMLIPICIDQVEQSAH